MAKSNLNGNGAVPKNGSAITPTIKPGKSMAKLQKSLFKVCHEIVKKRYAQNDLDNPRHAD